MDLQGRGMTSALLFRRISMETNRSFKKEALKAAVPVTIPVLTGFTCPGRAVMVLAQIVFV